MVVCFFLNLTGQLCYVRAPAEVHQSLYCKGSESLSSFMVTGAEELVSKVIQLGVQDGARVTFPIAVVIPFFTRYRGNCRVHCKAGG
uniref:Uncharacterized protein n=1 Tax=Knipowitschia caucasica TaxID=637954 RepID=A0AAV2KRT8_KNICA